jgi:hypothetical protein
MKLKIDGSKRIIDITFSSANAIDVGNKTIINSTI